MIGMDGKRELADCQCELMKYMYIYIYIYIEKHNTQIEN